VFASDVRACPIGAGIINVLETQCRSRGVDIALGKRVDRLLVDSGRVVGVAAGSDEVRAHTVVIATGGFGANPDLLKTTLRSHDAGWRLVVVHRCGQLPG